MESAHLVTHGLVRTLVPHILLAVLPVDVKVGDVDAGVVDGTRVLGVLLRGDADETVLVDVDGERVQAGQEDVDPDVELERSPPNSREIGAILFHRTFRSRMRSGRLMYS